MRFVLCVFCVCSVFVVRRKAKRELEKKICCFDSFQKFSHLQKLSEKNHNRERHTRGDLLSFLLPLFFFFFFRSSLPREQTRRRFPLSSLLFSSLLFARLPDAEKKPFKNHGKGNDEELHETHIVHGDS